jgi:hypothetical protein
MTLNIHSQGHRLNVNRDAAGITDKVGGTKFMQIFAKIGECRPNVM